MWLFDCSTTKDAVSKPDRTSRGIRIAESPMLMVWGDDAAAIPEPHPGYVSH